MSAGRALNARVRTASVVCGLVFSLAPLSLRLPVEHAPDAPQAGPFVQSLHTLAKKPAVGKPTKISIASIKLDTAVEELGITSDGKLDVPQKPLNTGWYKLGPKPGESGTAVIDGHLTLGGKPAAFWQLKKLVVGDTISVAGSDGITRTFIVRETAVYPVETAPLEKIFHGSDNEPHLNLITCAGTWSKKLGHYDKRLVVFTDLVD